MVVFCFKNITWKLLLAPSEYDFCTYRWIERCIQSIGYDFHFQEFHVDMIATDLSSQFMRHITTACYLGLLGASPYMLFELFRFVSPALYENERMCDRELRIKHKLLEAVENAMDAAENAAEMVEGIIAENV